MEIPSNLKINKVLNRKNTIESSYYVKSKPQRGRKIITNQIF